MNSSQTWDAIFAKLDEDVVQLKTKSGFWVTAYDKRENSTLTGPQIILRPLTLKDRDQSLKKNLWMRFHRMTDGLGARPVFVRLLITFLIPRIRS